MQAFRLKERNGIDSLELVHEEIPSFDKHEVLIKIKSVALNFRDIGVANGQYPFPVKDHVVPCSDACGEVVEVGDCVQGLSKGDLVVGTFDPTNLYGQQKDWVALSTEFYASSLLYLRLRSSKFPPTLAFLLLTGPASSALVSRLGIRFMLTFLFALAKSSFSSVCKI
jgi:NADPH:quinone reductase-like Zn-dependent oxidoreductase